MHGVGLKMAVGRERLKLEDLLWRERILSLKVNLQLGMLVWEDSTYYA